MAEAQELHKAREKAFEDLKNMDIISNGFESFFDHENDMPKDKAIEIFGKFLSGSWTNLKPEDINLTVHQGGFVNRIFICENLKATGDEPRKILLRLYGGKLIEGEHTFRNGTIMEEVLVFYTMSEAGLGPKLYGVFPEGRLEEFLYGHLINNEDILSPVMIGAFAKKLALFHNTDIPLKKTPYSTINKIDNLMPLVDEFKQECAPKELTFDLHEVVNWLKEVRPKIKSRTVLVHGDMNRANCIIREDREDPLEKVVLLDYEFSAYGWRGQDIGMHFASRHMDVNNAKDNFKSGLGPPTREEQLHFLHSYKDQIRAFNFYELDESEGAVDSDDMMLMDAEYFSMLFTILMVVTMLKDRKSGKGFTKLFNVTETDKMFMLYNAMNTGFSLARQKYMNDYKRFLQ